MLQVITIAVLAVALTLFAPNYAPPIGALNPDVTQWNLSTTACRPGWTEHIRPPSRYTTQLKRAQMAARHLPGNPEDYEEDHFVPLELGGHPTNPLNLWPQRWPAAHLKDRDEGLFHRAVCDGRMVLAAAQRAIATKYRAP